MSGPADNYANLMEQMHGLCEEKDYTVWKVKMYQKQEKTHRVSFKGASSVLALGAAVP